MKLKVMFVSEVTGQSFNCPDQAMRDENKLVRLIEEYKEAKKVSETPSYWDAQIRDAEKLWEMICDDRLKARVPAFQSPYPAKRIRAHSIDGQSIELEFFEPYMRYLSKEQIDELVIAELHREFLEMQCWEEIS